MFRPDLPPETADPHFVGRPPFGVANTSKYLARHGEVAEDHAIKGYDGDPVAPGVRIAVWLKIGLAWLMHAAWDLAHHLWGNPIRPFMRTSSFGCMIFDTLIAIWFLAGAPALTAHGWEAAAKFKKASVP